MELDRYPHAMLREIYEQPVALGETLEAYTEDGGLREEAFSAALHALAGQHSLLIGREWFKPPCGAGGAASVRRAGGTAG